MSSPYKPPASRMREIKKKAPAPLPRMPTTIEEALAQARGLTEQGTTKTEVDLELADGRSVHIDAGADQQFGTADDKVTVTPSREPEVVPEPVRARTEDGKFIADDPSTPDVNEAFVSVTGAAEPNSDYSTEWLKLDLLVLADTLGVKADQGMTKAKIVAALDAHFA